MNQKKKFCSILVIFKSLNICGFWIVDVAITHVIVISLLSLIQTLLLKLSLAMVHKEVQKEIEQLMPKLRNVIENSSLRFYVPNLSHNLLSVGQLIQNYFSVHFDDGKCKILDKMRNVVTENIEMRNKHSLSCCLFITTLHLKLKV